MTARKLRWNADGAHGAAVGERLDTERRVVVVGDPAHRTADVHQGAVGDADLPSGGAERTGEQAPQDLALDRRGEHVPVVGAVQQAHHAHDRVEQFRRGVRDPDPGRGRRRPARGRGGAGRSLEEQRGDGGRSQDHAEAQGRLGRAGQCVVPGHWQVDGGDQVLARPVVVHAVADGEALGALRDDGQGGSRRRRPRLARSVCGAEMDAVDACRRVCPGVARDPLAQLGEQRSPSVGLGCAHARNVHLRCATQVVVGAARTEVRQDRASTRQFCSHASGPPVGCLWGMTDIDIDTTRGSRSSPVAARGSGATPRSGSRSAAPASS